MRELKGNMIIQRKCQGINFFIEGFESDNTISYRTTGLSDKIGHEIEYNLSLDPMEVIRITDYILPTLFKGFEIIDKSITSTLTGAPVMLVITEPKYKYKEDEKILRIVFSDEDYKLPHQIGCHPGYAKQLE